MPNEDLIDINEAANIMHISKPTARDYKKRGLIKIVDKEGNKDLYSKKDILLRYSIIKEKRRTGDSLAQISSLMENELRQRGVA